VGEDALSGKKIAVIVESQYIPEEIRLYQELFSSYGATVDLVSRLWNRETARFYSTVDPENPATGDGLEWLEVSKDFDNLDPNSYAAVIVSANYTSVRLRWSEEENVDQANAAEVVSAVPAVRFIRQAMEDRNIIKGFSCHGLWLLTPAPELISGRNVICNKVVLADVLNAGAKYTPCPPGTPADEQVVVDGDLVTSNSWHCAKAMVDKIRDLILAREMDVLSL
jgi:putative intracellular protease/amidase